MIQIDVMDVLPDDSRQEVNNPVQDKCGHCGKPIMVGETVTVIRAKDDTLEIDKILCDDCAWEDRINKRAAKETA